MTWKEWLEEKKSDDHFFPAEQKCIRYALISRYLGAYKQGSTGRREANALKVKVGKMFATLRCLPMQTQLSRMSKRERYGQGCHPDQRPQRIESKGRQNDRGVAMPASINVYTENMTPSHVRELGRLATNYVTRCYLTHQLRNGRPWHLIGCTAASCCHRDD